MAGTWRRFLAWIGLADQEEEEEPYFPQYDAAGGGEVATVRPISPSRPQQVEAVPEAPTETALRIVPLRPERLEDATAAAAEVKRGRPVILVLRQLDPQVRQRFVDMVAGVMLALEGRMTRVDEGVLLLTPAGVEVPEEEQRGWLESQRFFQEL
jgi:FtsZ-interacting cell division protein YlmF